MTLLSLNGSNQTTLTPKEGLELKTSENNSSWTASQIISAPFKGIYYAGKGVYTAGAYTGRAVFAVGQAAYNFPNRLQRAELTPILLTSGGIAAFAMQRRVSFTSPAGVTGSVLGIYLAANIVYGLAIPLVAIAAGATLYEHYNPGTFKEMYSKDKQFIQLHLAVASPEELEKIEKTTKAASEAAEKAAKQIAEAESATANLERAKLVAAAAKGPSLAYGIYSKFALGAGASLLFAGQSMSLIGEGLSEAGMTATEDAFEMDDKKKEQLRMAVKITTFGLSTLATAAIAMSTGASLPFLALSIGASAGQLVFDIKTGAQANTKTHNTIKDKELNKVGKEENQRYKKGDAGFALTKGIALEVLGRATSNIGSIMIQTHGGFIWQLATSVGSNLLRNKAVLELYGESPSSYLDYASEGITQLSSQVKEAVKVARGLKDQPEDKAQLPEPLTPTSTEINESEAPTTSNDIHSDSAADTEANAPEDQAEASTTPEDNE